MRFLVVVAVGDPEIEGIGDDQSTWPILLMRDLRQRVRWVVVVSEKG